MSYLPFKPVRTFTPTISGRTSTGIGTYIEQYGFVHIVGGLVFVVGTITWTAHTGTGDMLITNLPYACQNIANYDPECAIRTDHIIWPAGSTYIFGEFQTGLSQIQLWGLRTNASPQLIQMDPEANIHFAGFYITTEAVV